MSAVSILASGAQADTGVSAAFDATAFATMRLEALVQADHGRSPSLAIFIDTAKLATGPWTQLYSKRLASGDVSGSERAWPADNTVRIPLAGFDAFLRYRWEAVARGNTDNKNTTCGLTLALTGTGLP